MHVTYNNVYMCVYDLIFREKLDLTKMFIKIFACYTETPK